MIRQFSSIAILLTSLAFAAELPPKPTVARFTHYERLTLDLPKAFRNQRDLTLHFGVHDGEILQAWGELEGVDRIIDHFDEQLIEVAEDRLSGELVMTAYVPEDEKVYRCHLEIDATRSGDQLSGSFHGNTASRGDELVFRKSEGILEPEDVDYFVFGEEGRGEVDITTMPVATPGAPVRFSLHTMHVLSGDRSMERYVTLEFTHRQGRITQAVIKGRGEDPWKGEIKSIGARFDGDALEVDVTAFIKGDALKAGDYTLRLTGRVKDNLVLGTTASSLKGKRIASAARFGGEAVPVGSPTRETDVVYRFTMPTAREGRLPLFIHATRSGDGWRPGQAMVDYRIGVPMNVDLAGLDPAGRELSGSMRVELTRAAHAIPGKEPMPTTYSLVAKRDGTSYKGRWSCRYGNKIDCRGELTGLTTRSETLARTQAIRSDWPCWNGPHGNFTAESGGHRLIDRLPDARLVWRSEQTPPGRCQTTRYGDGNIENFLTRGGPAGGSCSPIVVDGKVFLAYPRPAGPAYHEKDLELAKGKRDHVLGLLWKAKGEDVVLALDAATGRTLWRTVFPGGLYRDHPIMGSSKIGVYSTNVAAAEGRVFVRTTSGWTFALDARNGKVLWSSRKGGGIHRAVIGGALVSSSGEFTALDAATGETRWSIANANTNRAMPVQWVHGGQPRIIAGNLDGEIRCIEPVDGRVLWTINDSGINAYTLTVGTNHLLANQQREEKKPARLVCYRISPNGFEKLWEHVGDYPWSPNSHPPVIIGRHVILKTSVAKESSRGDDFVVFDLGSGKPVHRIPSNAAGSNGQTYWMDGRLISQADASHSKTPLLLYDAADPTKLRQLGEVWPTRHHPTSAYSPMFMTHAPADGRIIIRGGRGLFCYDLRAR